MIFDDFSVKVVSSVILDVTEFGNAKRVPAHSMQYTHNGHQWSESTMTDDEWQRAVMELHAKGVISLVTDIEHSERELFERIETMAADLLDKVMTDASGLITINTYRELQNAIDDRRGLYAEDKDI